MALHFEPVTLTNRKQIEALGVLPEQKGFIETVSQCLSEADEDQRWHPVGIYDDDTLVGFAMYGYFDKEYSPNGRLWLDRLLIDSRYQGKGYGKASLSGLLGRLSIEFPHKDIYLSVIKGNDTAALLYQQFGFHFTGEKDTHGEDVMKKEPASK